MNKNLKIFLNTMFWGFALWLFGYLLSILLFAFIPNKILGWVIMPFGAAFTLLILLKMIKREYLKCYIGLGIIWTIMAVALDYLFIVKLFNSADYYKFDVYIYYALTLLLPIAVGMHKFNKK